MMYENVKKRLHGAHFIFALIALIFGLIFIQITPPFWGTDETSHFARTYQLAHGQLLPDKDKVTYGGNIPANLLPLITHSQADLVDNKDSFTVVSRKDVDDVNSYKPLTSQEFSSQQTHFLWTASYSPIAYVGSIVGVIFADLLHLNIGHTIFMGRLGGLVLYIGLIFWALKILADIKLKWLVFMVGLLPTSLYQASVITADNMAIALALLFTALFIRLHLAVPNAAHKKLFWCLVITGVLLPLVKVNYIFLSFGLLLVPQTIFKSGRLMLALKTISVAMATLIALGWSSVMKVTADAPVSQRPDGLPVNANAQTLFMEHHPLHFLEACVRTVAANINSYVQSVTSLMGWNYITIPYIFIFLLCLGFMIAALYAKPELTKPLRKNVLLLALLSLAGVASIYAALYVAFNPVGNPVVDGVQGRYFIPFLVPVLLAATMFLPVEVRIKDRAAPYLFASLSVIGLAVSALYYWLATY